MDSAQQRLQVACDATGALSGQPLSLFQRASERLCAGDYDTALLMLDQLTQLEFQYWAIWYQRAVALHELADFENAIASYQAAQRLTPPLAVQPEIWYQQADALHYGIGNYAQAIAAYDQVIALAPDHYLGWLHRGNAQLYGLREPYSALASYNRALELESQDGWLWYNRGQALAELGFHYAAIHNYDRALNLHPDPARVQAARQAAVEQLHQQLGDSAGEQQLTLQEWQQLAAVPTAREVTPAPDPADDGAFSSTYVQFDTVIQPHQVIPYAHPTEGGATATAVQHQAIVVVQDSQGLRQVAIEGDRLTVGRASNCDLRLFSKFASRCHAVMIKEPTSAKSGSGWCYRLRDGDLSGQASTNGITVNGKKVKEHVLESGDLVHFGPKVWFRYFITAV